MDDEFCIKVTPDCAIKDASETCPIKCPKESKYLFTLFSLMMFYDIDLRI